MNYRWKASYAHLNKETISKLSNYLEKKIAITKIAKKLNIGTQTIKKYCEDHNIYTHQSKYKENWDTNFFNNLNKLTAYWSGFLFADGSIRKHTLEFQLSSSDKIVLEKFCKAIKCSKKNISFKKTTNSNRIIISKFQLLNDLKKWGIIENKTYKFLKPDIPKKLIPHFLRGWFDGDGSISYYKQKKNLRIQFDLTSGPEHIKYFCNELHKLGFNKKFYIGSKKNNFAKYARISSPKFTYLEDFYKVLEVSNNEHLERKWNKFHEFKKIKDMPVKLIKKLSNERNPKNVNNGFVSKKIYNELLKIYKKNKYYFPITERQVELSMSKANLVSKGFTYKGKSLRRWVVKN